jgi:hypothetical protein
MINEYEYDQFGRQIVTKRLADGDPSATRPSVSGDFIRLIGWAENADVVAFFPSSYHIEVE